MQHQPERRPFPFRPGASNANVTSAVGMEETVGRRRARRTSLFTQTMLWTTGLICIALLLGSLAQAWSNSLLMTQVQDAEKNLNQLQTHHQQLQNQVKQYSDPAVIENEARQQLGYIRPGEHSIIVVSAQSPDSKKSPPAANKAAPSNFWQQWWDVFFGG